MIFKVPSNPYHSMILCCYGTMSPKVLEHTVSSLQIKPQNVCPFTVNSLPAAVFLSQKSAQGHLKISIEEGGQASHLFLLQLLGAKKKKGGGRINQSPLAPSLVQKERFLSSAPVYYSQKAEMNSDAPQKSQKNVPGQL